MSAVCAANSALRMLSALSLGVSVSDARAGYAINAKKLLITAARIRQFQKRLRVIVIVIFYQYER
jgi:hypothetical protein